MTLLILGSDSDPNSRRIVDHAHLRSVPYVQLDCDNLGTITLRWRLDSPEIRVNNERITPSALYLRHNVFSESQSAQALDLYAGLQAFGAAHPDIKMMNRNSSGGASNKSANLSTAESVGFDIPSTEVVVSSEAIAPLFDEFEQANRVVKPMEGGDHCVPLHALDAPYPSYKASFIQDKLPGRNVRCFVIDGETYCFELETTDLDYRTDPKCNVIPTDVPDDILTKAKLLAATLRFDYCALDFRGDADGKLVFLEINSFPMFVAFDNRCGNALADAQLRFLSKGWFDYPV